MGLSWRVASGRRIGRAGSLCNGATALVLAVLLGGAQWGCTKDEAAVEGVDGGKDGGASDAVIDAEVIADVPVPPLDLLRRMPRPPDPIAAVPGDLAEGLSRARPSLEASMYSERVLVDRPKNGPFSMVHYQLTPDGTKVRAVLATFVDGYKVPERKDALVEAIDARLGKGSPLQIIGYKGTRWTTLPFRIDLRTDDATGDLELLYHTRGRVDPVVPPPPL